ncbi:MAG: hypothetical protein JKY54_06855, partial [Flavobacteriales bacterium]|nr:hypothetical protein [Flavobacteriales bacterium]
MSAFTDHCLGLNEDFIMKFTDKEYHYTLYYYDQAGNLIKTIPPEGVEFVNTTSSFDAVSQSISADRGNHTQTVYTFHRLETQYVYNSLNQLVKQSLPDHDQMDICELTLPSGLDGKFRAEEVQFVNSSLGFVAGWTLYGGQRRGVLYETTNGGVAWSKVNHIVASDLKSTQWIDDGTNSIAYAVGKHGILLRSENGALTWDMVDLYGDNITADLNDLYLDNSESGLLVGNNGMIVDYSPGSANIITPIVSDPAYPINGNDHITSIKRVGSEYYITVNHTNGASESFGLMYRSPNGTNWEVLHKVKAPVFNDIQFVDNTTAIAVGNDGLLLKTIDAGSNWFVQSSSDKASIAKVFFKDPNNGVAIRNGGLLYATYDGGNTWNNLDPVSIYNDFSVFDPSPGTAKLVAVGNASVVSRIILMSGTAGLIPISIPTPVNLTTVWTETVGITLKVVTAGSTSDIYYSESAGGVSAVWDNVNAGLGPIASLAFDLDGPNFNGVVATTTGDLEEYILIQSLLFLPLQ